MKRSHAVFAVMAAATVGVGGYSLMPSEQCGNRAGVVDPPTASSSCSRSSGGSGGGHGSRSIWGASRSGGDAGGGSSGNSGTTERGGFGGFARSIAAHFSGS